MLKILDCASLFCLFFYGGRHWFSLIIFLLKITDLPSSLLLYRGKKRNAETQKGGK